MISDDLEFPASGDVVGQREADGSMSIHTFGDTEKEQNFLVSTGQMTSDLEYYLGYRPDSTLVAEAEEWQQNNPGSGLSEWVSAMIEIGAL